MISPVHGSSIPGVPPVSGTDWWRGTTDMTISTIIGRVCARTINESGVGIGATKGTTIFDMCPEDVAICRATSPRHMNDDKPTNANRRRVVYDSRNVRVICTGSKVVVRYLTPPGELSLPGSIARPCDQMTGRRVHVFFGVSPNGVAVRVEDIAETLQRGIEHGMIDPAGLFTVRLCEVDNVFGVVCSMSRLSLDGLVVVSMSDDLNSSNVLPSVEEERWAHEWVRAMHSSYHDDCSPAVIRVRVMTGLLLCLVNLCCRDVNSFLYRPPLDRRKSLLQSLLTAHRKCTYMNPPPGVTIGVIMSTVYRLVLIARHATEHSPRHTLIRQVAVVLRDFAIGGGMESSSVFSLTPIDMSHLYDLVRLLIHPTSPSVHTRTKTDVNSLSFDAAIQMHAGPTRPLPSMGTLLPEYAGIVDLMAIWLRSTPIDPRKWDRVMRGCDHDENDACACNTNIVTSMLTKRQPTRTNDRAGDVGSVEAERLYMGYLDREQLKEATA